jgi:hypothetical protein
MLFQFISIPTTNQNELKPTTKMDGHFWVERNQQIIDTTPEDPDFMRIAPHRGFTGEREYLPAASIVQTIMIKSYTADVIAAYNKATGCSATTLAEVYENSPIQNPKANLCYKNAFYEQWKNGGTVVFGSMGYKAHWTNEIFWEFGGLDFVLPDFLGKNTAKRDLCIQNSMKKFVMYLAGQGLNKKQIHERMTLCC